MLISSKKCQTFHKRMHFKNVSTYFIFLIKFSNSEWLNLKKKKNKKKLNNIPQLNPIKSHHI